MNEKELAQLRQYGELEQTEYGDAVIALIDAYEFSSFAYNRKFRKALIKEMKEHLLHFQERTFIVRHTDVVTKEWFELEYVE